MPPQITPYHTHQHRADSHLLGKKSWNVYNADNIARVQRDEAAAAAAELAAEQRMQDVDAARRLAILRGETPPPLPEADDDDRTDNKLQHKRGRDGSSGGFAPRKRKRAGEDDTDFEMRVAREQAEVGARVAGELGSGTAGGVSKRQKQKDDVNIVDNRGHIDLVGPPPDTVGGGKNAEYEREAAQKKREAEFPITMRFADAAGRDGLASGQPWYIDGQPRQATGAAATQIVTKEDQGEHIGTDPPMKNVWGKDDPKRRGRDNSRMTANDPMAAMRAGAKKVRDIEKERRRDAEERKRELKQLYGEEHREREKRRTREKTHIYEDDHEREDRSLSRPHRSERSERSHNRDKRHERRHRSGHREERRHRRAEDERDRDRENDRHHWRETERSRERGTATRSHRDKDDSRRSRQDKDASHRSRRDMDDHHHHRGKRHDSSE